jgi:hypothetical protein
LYNEIYANVINDGTSLSYIPLITPYYSDLLEARAKSIRFFANIHKIIKFLLANIINQQEGNYKMNIFNIYKREESGVLPLTIYVVNLFSYMVIIILNPYVELKVHSSQDCFVSKN